MAAADELGRWPRFELDAGKRLRSNHWWGLHAVAGHIKFRFSSHEHAVTDAAIDEFRSANVRADATMLTLVPRLGAFIPGRRPRCVNVSV